MSLDFSLPPDALDADFDRLEDVLRHDVAGDKARSLRRYFLDAELEMRTVRARQTDFDQIQATGLVAEAFGAAARSVVSAWNALHGRELAV